VTETVTVAAVAGWVTVVVVVTGGAGAAVVVKFSVAVRVIAG